MKAYNIKWDLGDDLVDYNIDDCDIPTETEIPDWVTESCVTDEEICDAVADYLSDEYGYCVTEFNLSWKSR